MPPRPLSELHPPRHEDAPPLGLLLFRRLRGLRGLRGLGLGLRLRGLLGGEHGALGLGGRLLLGRRRGEGGGEHGALGLGGRLLLGGGRGALGLGRRLRGGPRAEVEHGALRLGGDLLGAPRVEVERGARGPCGDLREVPEIQGRLEDGDQQLVGLELGRRQRARLGLLPHHLVVPLEVALHRVLQLGLAPHVVAQVLRHAVPLHDEAHLMETLAGLIHMKKSVAL